MQADAKRLAANLGFPEGPRWRDGALWFSDIERGAVCRLTPGGPVETVVKLDGSRPSGLGFLPDGSVLIVSMQARQLLRWSQGELSLYADLTGMPGEFLNDMVVDVDGRAYVGARSNKVSPAVPHNEAGGPDCVIVVEPDGRVSIGAEDLCAPNGTVISPDGRTLIIAETYARRVACFDRDPSSGRLSGRRLFARFERTWPDGICLDAEGAVWACSPYSSEVVRVSEGSRVDQTVPLRGAVACMLGGEGRRTLFVLAVDPSFLPPTEEATSFPRDDDGGCVHAIEVAVAGAGWP